MEVPDHRPASMQSYLDNTRQPLFRDARVRRARAYAFAFEWSDRHLPCGADVRSRSDFSEPPRTPRGRPSGEELRILEPFRGQVPAEIFADAYAPPVTDGDIRSNLREAFCLLRTDAPPADILGHVR